MATAALASESRSALTPPPSSTAWSAGVWAITLWTAGRAPRFVGMGPKGLGLNELGELVQRHWEEAFAPNPTVTLDELGVLPDRLRALIHVPWDRPAGALGRIVARFKRSLTRSARQAGLLGRNSCLWEVGFEGSLVKGPDELAFWRRRIRVARANGRAESAVQSPES